MCNGRDEAYIKEKVIDNGTTFLFGQRVQCSECNYKKMFKLVLITSLVAISSAEPRPKSEQTQTLNSVADDKAQDKISSFPTGDDASKDSQFASTQVLENPAYDPAIYQSFIPQDAVQQYVSQFASPYAGYSGVYPGVSPGGFAVQTGYEGYLVPAMADSQDDSLTSTGFGFLRNFLTRSFIGWVTRAASYIASALGVVLFGGAVTTALCTFTPLCTITFAALPFFKIRESAENITKTLSTEITPDRVRRTAELVKEAIDKYTEMQKQFALTEETDTNIQKIEKDTSDKDL